MRRRKERRQKGGGEKGRAEKSDASSWPAGYDHFPARVQSRNEAIIRAARTDENSLCFMERSSDHVNRGLPFQKIMAHPLYGGKQKITAKRAPPWNSRVKEGGESLTETLSAIN